MKKIEFFKPEGDRINRVRRHCPKCGPAVFLADHKNRFSCGKCGYTEFKGEAKKRTEKPQEPAKQIQIKEEIPETEKIEEEASDKELEQEVPSQEESSKE